MDNDHIDTIMLALMRRPSIFVVMKIKAMYAQDAFMKRIQEWQKRS